MRPAGVIVGAAALMLWCAAADVHGQFPLPGVSYQHGLDVSPTFEGWEANADGSYTFYFGYYNRNTQEQLDVPIGPDNSFDGGAVDRGQPTHFYTGRRWFVFRVVVPANWPKQQRLVWRLTSHGRTNEAKGWLQPEWEIDKDLMAKNGARDPFIRGAFAPAIDDQPPQIAGIAGQSVTLPAAAVLSVTATDDGIPKPQARRAEGGRSARPEGMQVRWIFYRGPAMPTFEPEVSPMVYGKPLTFTSTVTFPMPGTYRLRAIASDGLLFSTHDVDVIVAAGGER